MATADQLTDVLANSNVDVSARLVYSGEVVHTETTQLSGNLSAFQDPNDGVMDEVHDIRNATSADLMALLVETGTNSATGCGVAYLMSSLDPGFESVAFSVTKRRCAPELVFSHEVGHNLGLHHDTYVAPGPGLFGYSHGYVNIDSMNVPPGRPGIRTPLAYHSRCQDAGGECVRIPYYSTIEQLYNGQVIGDAVTADNVRTVRQSAALAAGFRAPLLLATEAGDTAGGATWQRPECPDPGDMGTCAPSGSATAVPYATMEFEVTAAGRHYVRGTASFDGVLLVYAGGFDAGSPLTGLVGYAEADPSAPESRRLLLPADLEPSTTYVLVTTGRTNGDAGTFANDVFGPVGGGVVVGIEGGPPGDELALTAPVPNPARGTVALAMTAGRAQQVRVDVFDALGRRVARLFDGRLAGGAPERLSLDVADLAPGAYVVRAIGEETSVSRRVTVTR